MTTRRKKPKKPESFAAGVGRGLRLADKERTQDGAHARHSHIFLEERQGRRREALMQSRHRSLP